MTTITDLIDAYNKTLAGHSPVISSGAANDAFEIYTLTLVLRAAKEEGATISFSTRNELSKPSRLIFRTSPGNIYSSTKDYAHAIITFPNDLVYEAHIGVYVEGLAKVLHECDVSVIKSSEARFCRRNEVHPKKHDVLLTAECKFYTGKLGISLGREFLGLTTDLGATGRFMVSNSNGRSVDRVLAHHERKRHFSLSPLNKDSEAQTVAQFRDVFRNIKSKNN